MPPSALLEMGDRRVILGPTLGAGSVAKVYRGVLESAHGVRRPVACKVFGSLAFDDHDGVLEGLAQAVRGSACIRHPNVVETYEIGVTRIQRQAFILSELIVGTTLRRMIDCFAVRGRRLPLDVALFIGTEVAEGLSGARVARGPEGLPLGICHLDLSARDVLLSWHGEVKVTDFEIGTVRQASSSIRSFTKLARRVVTMAPEVAAGEPGDARSDVFSLGILLREMLIGPRFSPSTTDIQAIDYAREGYLQPMTFEPHLPEDVRRILNRALEVDPDRRFPHAGAMAYELRRVALSLGVGDARIFLKTTLERELAEDHSDSTIPQHSEAKRLRQKE